ncbi:MAG: ABC transporter ATP-binding protein [Candidatus Aminicenantes bacterium]|nr:ABC transporter ATP-binding protein [Candidatus Aminicenantes bacterium]
MMETILEIKNLAKSFGRRRVLENIGFSVQKGDIIGLLGLNGEGKTTLIRSIMGVIPFDRGAISYKGAPLTFKSGKQKRDIAYVPEDSFFYTGLTVGEHLRLNASFYPSRNQKRCDDLTTEFELPLSQKIGSLSRGQKLKLALVMALATEPNLILLDDSTSGLDVPTRKEFLRGIIRDYSDRGASVLFATHLVHEIEGLADRILILHQGQILVDEKIQTLKDKVKPNEAPTLEDIFTGFVGRREVH